MSDLLRQLRERDKIVREHHYRRTGVEQPSPMTLEGMAADEIERLRDLLREISIQAREISSQAHNLPRSATADRINELATSVRTATAD